MRPFLAENRTLTGPVAGQDEPVPRTVLIVDDHAGFRRRARRALEAEGYEVVGEAPSGADGIEAAAALRPDIVLLDVHLPDASGFDIVSRILAPAVVLISTHDRHDYARHWRHRRNDGSAGRRRGRRWCRHARWSGDRR